MLISGTFVLVLCDDPAVKEAERLAMRQYTNELAGNAGLWLKMSHAARERANLFDRRHYVDRFLHVLGPLMTTNAGRDVPRETVTRSQA